MNELIKEECDKENISIQQFIIKLLKDWFTMIVNPIGAVLVAIMALIAGIVLLTKWLSKSTDETGQ